jgi:hypothetical protein
MVEIVGTLLERTKNTNNIVCKDKDMAEIVAKFYWREKKNRL